MRYFYQKPSEYIVSKAQIYQCNHPLYSQCTLYKEGDKGLAVVQQRFNSRLKVIWWGPIDPWLVDDIWQQDGFERLFERQAACAYDGLYPTVTVRKVMWELRMRPLPRQYWERDI